jgi:hypothetical protein
MTLTPQHRPVVTAELTTEYCARRGVTAKCPRHRPSRGRRQVEKYDGGKKDAKRFPVAPARRAFRRPRNSAAQGSTHHYHNNRCRYNGTQPEYTNANRGRSKNLFWEALSPSLRQNVRDSPTRKLPFRVLNKSWWPFYWWAVTIWRHCDWHNHLPLATALFTSRNDQRFPLEKKFLLVLSEHGPLSPLGSFTECNTTKLSASWLAFQASFCLQNTNCFWQILWEY